MEDFHIPIVILDNNEYSIMKYAEKYPESWKQICEAVEKKNAKTLQDEKVKGVKNG